jgi:hypothetical protein
MDSQMPINMLSLWMRKYCAFLVQLKHFAEVETHLEWTLKQTIDVDEKSKLFRHLSLTLAHQKSFRKLELISSQHLERVREAIPKGAGSQRIIFPSLHFAPRFPRLGAWTIMAAEQSLELHQRNFGVNDSNMIFLVDLARECGADRFLQEVSTAISLRREY